MDDWGGGITKDTAEWMEFLGEFAPTAHAKDKELKGCMYDAESATSINKYLSSANLRALASACTEVADWLDKRAGTEANTAD